MTRARKLSFVFSIATILTIVSAQQAKAQLIVGQDGSGTTGGENEFGYYLDISGGSANPTQYFRPADQGLLGGPDAMAVDDVGRRIYYAEGSGTTRSALYAVDYDDYRFDFTGYRRIRKIGDIRTPSGGLQIISGLAWDTVNQRLIGSDVFNSTSGLGEEGFHLIDKNTGASTLIYAMTSTEQSSYDLRGFEYNPADGFYYATDESTSGGFSGLVRVNLNGASTTMTNLITYTALGFSNIDGLAIGNNRAYFINGTTGVNIGVYNIGTALVEPSIPAVPWGATQANAAGGWGPNALVVPAGSNLGGTISSTSDPAVDVESGNVISYSVRFANFGPSSATNVTYTITLGGTATGTISNIVSSSATAVESPTGTITATFPTFSNNQLEDITFDVTTTAPGTLQVTASIPPGANTDAYLLNNTETISHNVRVFPPIEVEFSTVASSPTSDVPGLGGLKFQFDSSSTTQKFRKPYRSATGSHIALWADTDDASNDEIFIVRDGAGNWSVGAQENITAPTQCEAIGSMILNPAVPVNDNGQFAYANDTSAATSSDETVIVYDGISHNVVSRQGAPIPVIGGVYGTTSDSPAIDGKGRAAFRTASIPSPVPTAENSALLADNGQRLLAQKGVTVPSGQAGGATEAWESFDADTLFIDCLGVDWLVRGDLTGATSGDDILAVNGQVVLQQGQGVTGLTGTLPEPSTTAGVIWAEMNGNGDWFARGTMSDTTQDFVIRGHGTSYSLLAKLGDPIYTGATEHWSDVDGYSPTFFGVAINTQGDYVIAGRTDNTATNKNAAVVFNGTTELFRENDPVDLDLNGQFDDNAFVSNFDVNISDWMVLTDAGEFYCVANLRDSAEAFIGKALLKFNVAASPIPNAADIYVQSSVSDDSLESVGQQTHLSVQVCNYGPVAATNVQLTVTLPAGLEFVSATNGATETSPGSGVVTATIGSLSSCICQVYDITIEGAAEGSYNIPAMAVATQTDPNNANNTASAGVNVVNRADVSVSIADNGGSAIGGNFVYTITVTNNGPATATNVQLTDNLDPTTSFVSATNGAVQGPVGVVTRTFASIAPNSSQIVQITVGTSVQALATNTVSVSATEPDDVPANNVASIDTPIDNSADLSITLTDNGLHNINANYNYVLTVYNDGPATATSVQVTASLPGGLSFVSGTNGAVEIPGGSGNVQASFASMPSQSTQVILITAVGTTPGDYTVNASVTAAEPDLDGLNNTATLTSRLGQYRQILPIYTRIAGDPTSVVPGLVDYDDQPVFGQFDSMLNINVSPDGTRWTVDASSDLSDTNIDSVMMLGSGFTGTVFAQEGKQAVDAAPCTTYTFFDDDVGFNSNNDFSWGAITSGPDITYTNINGVDTNVAQALDPILGLVDPNGAGDETIANSMVSEHLLDDGSVGFVAGNINNILSTYRPALAYWDSFNGITAFMQSNVTVIGADTITGFPIDRVFYTTPDGAHTLIRATTAAGSLLARDSTKVIGTGDVFGAVTIDAIFDSQLATNGDWIARGDQPGDDDWVIRNGVVVAATGQPIVGGAETWGNAIGTARVNANGDYLIGGNTSNPDTNADNVLVLNGTDIVVREGDPVDLDGNGAFDDNVFINVFTANEARLSIDRKVHFLATLRTAEGTNLQTAFLVVDVSAGCPTISGDAGGDGFRNGLDVEDFVNCILTGGSPTGACKCVDYDSDNDVDFADLSAFATQLVNDPA